MHMHTNVILTNKRRTHAQSTYIRTKLKAWSRRLLRHPARKRSEQGSDTRVRTPKNPVVFFGYTHLKNPPQNTLYFICH